MTRAGTALAALGLLAIAGTAIEREAKLTLAFEDRGDPNPRQMSLGMKIAGVVVALAVSWTEHRQS